MSTRIITGDALAELAKLPAESVHCCVTSPPYFGLRDYQTASWEGGDPACDHRKGDLVSSKSSLRNDGREHIGPYAGEKAVSAGMPYAMLCGKCGAQRIDAQLGLEPTPDEYVAAMVGVFREVRRVLRSDATLWLNIGDSYANDGKWGGHTGGKHVSALHCSPIGRNKRYTGYKPKDLMGIPWMLAFALRADGWWLRQDIIWSKPNPMPESVTDRCTKAHEYIFLLSKSERYYFDAAAIAEDANSFGRQHTSGIQSPKTQALKAAGFHGDGGDLGLNYEREQRNKRSVWTIATAPYPGSHFAVFPPALVEPCILAGTSARGVCPKCGASWVRVFDRMPAEVRSPNSEYGHGAGRNDGGRSCLVGASNTTTGWVPSCRCQSDPPIPATVLDPFLGAGTTALVADRLGRNAIGIELNPTYSAMARRRIADDAGLFFEAAE